MRALDRRRPLRLLAAAAALMTGAVMVSNVQGAAPVTPSSAASQISLMTASPAVVAPATLTADGVAVPYPVTVSNFTAASLSATISVPSGRGTFSITTTSGLTALFGYPGAPGAPTSGHEIGFYGSNADVTEALASHLRWTGGSAGDVTVSVTVNAYDPSVSYNPTNGHYYEFVNTPVSWADASTGAASRQKFDMTGYLATITSQSENDFIASKVNAPSVWIGASDDAVEGEWRWMTGPEAGTQFWQGAAAGTTVSGSFAAWAASEPNSSGNCGLTNWGSPLGRWDDQPCNGSNLKSYLVEYGPPSGTVQAVSRAITASVAAPATLTVQVTGDGVVTSSQGGIDCGTTCSALVVPGLPVTLTATPGQGQRLASWGAPCSGSGACIVTLNSNTTVSATFELAPQLPPQLPGLVTQPVLTTTVPPSTTTPPSTTMPPTTTAPPATTPSPVPADGSGALPALQPGESQVIENGVATTVEVVVEDSTDLVLRGADFELRLAGECTSECTVQTDASGRQVIQLETNGAARVAGEGFLPGTPVYVWLFSTPTFLGELTVNADGSFSGLVPLLGVETGTHTLQVNGTSFDGEPRTANLGVVVTPAATPAPQPDSLPSTGQNLTGLVWGLALMAAGALLLAGRRRTMV